MSTDQTIGDNVHTLMWRYRIKQQDMYAAMGVSRSTLAKKLRGQVAWSADDVMVAARLLGVDPGALFVVPEQREARDTHRYHAPLTGVVIDLAAYRAGRLERAA